MRMTEAAVRVSLWTAMVAGVVWFTAGNLCAARAADTPGLEEVRLVIDKAAWGTNSSPERGKPFDLVLMREDGAWLPVAWGRTYTYNNAGHIGYLAGTKKDGPVEHLSLKMPIKADKWTVGADAEYEIRITPKGDRWEGTWEGRVREQPAKGDVRGQSRMLSPMLKDFVPPKMGEHPLLLFRQTDLPALRKKADTEWGRKAMKRLDGTVGAALRSVLSGDPALVAEARRKYMEAFDARLINYSRGRPHVLTDDLMCLFYAYDLICPTFTPNERLWMETVFEEWIPYVYNGCNWFLFNPADSSNWGCRFRAAAGVGTLCLLDEASGPSTTAPEILRLSPPSDLKVGQGLAVERLEEAKAWTNWIYVCPGQFAVGPSEDPLASLGGVDKARPEVGTTVTVEVRTGAGAAAEKVVRSFAAVGPDQRISADWANNKKQTWMAGVPDLTALSGRQGGSVVCLYSVIENENPAYYRPEAMAWGALNQRLYIAGRRVEIGSTFFLEKGRFPVVFVAPLTWVQKTHNIPLGLRLVASTEADAKDWVKSRQFDWEVDRAIAKVVESRRAKGKASSHMSVMWTTALRIRMENYALYSLGEHGWMSEGESYTQPTLWLLFAFAHAYRNATGLDLCPEPNLRMVLPLYAARTVFGDSAARMESYGPGGGPLGVDNYARGFGTVPSEYRPAVLWAWNRTQALADAGKLKDPHFLFDTLDDLSAAFFFVNYPVEMQEANPSTVLPNVVVDKQRGGYVFRNRWQDNDDIVCQILLNQSIYTGGRGGSWGQPDTADFRISGLGADWAVRGTGFGHTKGANHWRSFPHPRMYQNIVQVTGPIAGNAMPAPLMSFEAQSNGSGVVSMNLDLVYAGDKPGAEGEKKVAALPWVRQGAYDIGIRGMRSFGVDYSGVCGAPCLVAVADRITGSPSNRWEFCTPQQHRVTVDANTFAIAATNSGATLKATVVAPAACTISTTNMVFGHEINCVPGFHHNGVFPRTVVSVRNGDYFLVVMTIQRGEAPVVKVEGEGLSALVRVGGQSVKFDGQKIVFAAGK